MARKLIVTSEGRLKAKYGEAGWKRIETAVKGLVKGDAARGVETTLVSLDAKALGKKAVKKSAAPESFKAAIDLAFTQANRPEYLVILGDVCGMTVLTEPVTHRSDAYGWAGWVHWETSGAHFYAWDRPERFFSVDVYTCKAFDPREAIAFTHAFFAADEIVGREF